MADRCRHYKLEAELAEVNWRVRWDDIMFGAQEKRKLERSGSRLSLARVILYLLTSFSPTDYVIFMARHRYAWVAVIFCRGSYFFERVLRSHRTELNGALPHVQGGPIKTVPFVISC